MLGCEGDGNAGVGFGVGVVVVSVYICGICGSGVLSSAGDVLEMSVVIGVDGLVTGIVRIQHLFTVFGACRPCGPAGWLALLLSKAGDVETNPDPTTLTKQVWICDTCHKQIHVRKQISIRCNRIKHWVHLRCAGICQAQYTDTWTCHLPRESRLTQT